MVLVFFGQPHSGKTTLANALVEISKDFVKIDGDNLREVFRNKDFSREGRIKNLQKASDIAAFLNSQGKDVICSLVYPYVEARSYLKELVPDSKWVFLTYNENRGRENFHVDDFEMPDEEDVLFLNTSTTSVNECLVEIISHINQNHDSENIS